MQQVGHRPLRPHPWRLSPTAASPDARAGDDQHRGKPQQSQVRQGETGWGKEWGKEAEQFGLGGRSYQLGRGWGLARDDFVPGIQSQPSQPVPVSASQPVSVPVPVSQPQPGSTGGLGHSGEPPEPGPGQGIGRGEGQGDVAS